MSASGSPEPFLKRCSEVFGLALDLYQKLHEEFGNRQIDLASWDRFRPMFEEFVSRLSAIAPDLAEAPADLADVVASVREAGKLARQIREIMAKPESRDEGRHLGFWVEFNTIAYNGYQAVKAARRRLPVVDPLAAFESPQASDDVASPARPGSITHDQPPVDDRPPAPATVVGDSGQPSPSQQTPRPFAGGEIVFHADRVELYGIDICSGSRSKSKRIVLELLSRKRGDGSYSSFSGAKLAREVKEQGGRGTASGLVRDLRKNLAEALLKKGIACGPEDVILSGAAGYRFAETVTVRPTEASPIRDIRNTSEGADVPNVPKEDVPDVPNRDVPNRDVPNVPDVPNDEADKRRQWILQQLEKGVPLKVATVASQFNRSKKTVQRDLNALKDQGKIEFVGDPRTGYYRLKRQR